MCASWNPLFVPAESLETECTILNQDSPKIDRQSSKIKIQLKQHQKSLVYRCRELENSTTKKLKYNGMDIVTKFGIIGDIVGSGKTLSILSIISDHQKLKTHIEVSYHNDMVSIKSNQMQAQAPLVMKQNVIVVPHNIFKQWVYAIENHSDLKYIGINNKKTLDIFEKERNKLSFQENDIILVSSTRYNKFATCYYSKDKIFSRIFFDEADTINIPSCDKVNASFTWFVTSTYNVLCNPCGTKYFINEETGEARKFYDYHHGFTRVQYIEGIKNTGFIKQTMMSFIPHSGNQFMDAIKPQLIIKNDDNYVKQAFNLPDYVTNILKSKNPISLSILEKFASKEIMNHINGGDIKGAISKLNCQKVSENDLIKGVTTDLEEQLNNKRIELEMKSKMTYSTENAKKESLDKIKGKITDLENKISGIKNKINDNNICSICYDEIENTALTKCCNTKFCVECITKWLYSNKQCPFCRANITNDNICVVTDEIDNSAGYKEELPTKLQHLKNIIQNNKDKSSFKLLIFADYDNSFNDIISYLNEIGLKHSKVMGSVATIGNIIRRYKSNDISDKLDILMLNADYCASGMNLENTTDIILFHSMTEQKTKQIIGRGQRPGRTNALNIWKLCYSTEI
jgi:hypothetical protein